MSRLQKVLLFDPDQRAKSTLVFGFEREGVTVVQADDADTAANALGEVDVALIGGEPAVVARVRQAAPRIPVLFLGKEAVRAEAMSAGAADFLVKPTYVRDVVTLARLHASGRDRASWQGDLGEFYSLYYLIRACSAVNRTGILNLHRGVRRGEVRFYEGEVTSAQCGMLHGLAALHQLLLWTEGRFELRADPIVRRQQIPLSPAEVLEDADRFLRDFRELGRDLSPSAVYEQDLRRVAECVDKIPKEVNPVLRLFDGVRTIADVVEDSPFRVFETVKIAVRLVELEAVRRISTPRARTGAQAALAIDDWLIGNATPSRGVPAMMSAVESAAVGPPPGEPAKPPSDGGGGTRKSKKKRRPTEPGITATSGPAVVVSTTRDEGVPSMEWGALATPQVSVWDGPGFAPVVPAQVVAGEIAPRPVPAGAAAAVAVSPLVAVEPDTQPQPRITHELPGADPGEAEDDAGAKLLVAAAAAVAEPGPTPPTVEGLLSTEPIARERLEDVLDRDQRSQLFADGPREEAKKPEVVTDEKMAKRKHKKKPAAEAKGVDAATGDAQVASRPLAEAQPTPAPVAETTAAPPPAPQPDVQAAPAPVVEAAPEPQRLVQAAAAPVAEAASAPLADVKPTAEKSASVPEKKRKQTAPPATFDDLDEQFFSSASSPPHEPTTAESFDDLDEGHPPPKSFWKRIFKKK